MSQIAALGMCAVLLGAVACAPVDSPVPIGNEPVAVQASDWNGTWLANKKAFVVRVADASKGTVEFAWIEEKDGALVMEKHSLQIRRTGDWMFLNIADPEKPDRYFWARLKNVDGETTVWLPAVDKFKALVKEGALSGSVDANGGVHLDALSDEQMKRLTSDDKGLLYDWDNPLTFRHWSEE